MQFAAAMTGPTGALTRTVAATPLFEPIQPMLAAEPGTHRRRARPRDLSGDIEFRDHGALSASRLGQIDELSPAARLLRATERRLGILQRP